MAWLNSNALSIILGVQGNVISFLVFLAPIPTFYTIYKKKTSDGFQLSPYVVALSSAMLLLYYGLLNTNAILIISIKAVGCVIEVAYLVLFAFYASRREKVYTRTAASYRCGLLRIDIVADYVSSGGKQCIDAVGWICTAFNIAVFAAPLTIMTKVVRTRSVEFMSFSLSFFLTLCATNWFFYGLLIKHMFIAVPNVIGFRLGIAQTILYVLYRNAKTEMDEAREKQINITKLHPCPTEPESKEMTNQVEKLDAPHVDNV